MVDEDSQDCKRAIGPPASGNPTAAASDSIPGDLALGDKSGYKFVLSDQSLVIREHYGQEAATAQSKEIK